MVTKIKQCYNILKYLPEPTTMKVIEISETVGCSERLVWMALKKLRDEREKASDIFRQIEELVSFCLYYQWFVDTQCFLRSEMKPVWHRRLKFIRKKLKFHREFYKLDEKGKREAEE